MPSTQLLSQQPKLFDVMRAQASERYWARWPDQRDLIRVAFKAHLEGLVAKYGARSDADLWRRTAPIIPLYDASPVNEPMDMEDAVHAYWITNINPGGILAFALFGFGFVDSAEQILGMTDVELESLPPKPWLDGPFVIVLGDCRHWLDASLERRSDAISALLQAAMLAVDERTE